MTRKEIIGTGALVLVCILGGLKVREEISKADAKIAAEKAEVARLAQGPVVRVCASGAFVRSIDGKLYVSDGRQSGWVPQDVTVDAVCQPKA